MDHLHTIKEAFMTSLKLTEDDGFVIDAVIATYIANIVPTLTEPVWLYIVGPASTSKTEILRPLIDYPKSKSVSSLTENALISGYSTEEGNDPSLILQLDGNVLIWKDLTTLITDNQARCSKILGDLRDAFDGECAKCSGTQGLRRYHAKFGLIAAATSVIDSFNEENQQLGERFLTLRTYRKPTDAESVLTFLDHVQASMPGKKKWRADLCTAIHLALNAIHTYALSAPPIVIPPAHSRQVRVLSFLLSQLRTSPIKGNPVDSEMPSRVFQQLMNLGIAHALSCGVPTWTDIQTAIVRRVAIDTLSISRRRVYMALYGKVDCVIPPCMTVTSIAAAARLTPAGTVPILEQYKYNGVIAEFKNNNEIAYSLTDKIRTLTTECGLIAPPAVPG